MATLELVPLRSSIPTGRMTLRRSIPAFNSVVLDISSVDDLLTTTPQVVESADDETAARKGGEAR